MTRHASYEIEHAIEVPVNRPKRTLLGEHRFTTQTGEEGKPHRRSGPVKVLFPLSRPPFQFPKFL